MGVLRSIRCAGAAVCTLAGMACGQAFDTPGGSGDRAPAEREDVAVTTQALTGPTVPQPSNSFTLFETLQVRPLALSPNGKLLFAANTPDNRLEVFKIESTGLQQVASVPVGLEPIAVAARTNDEVWVVNHLSDSVSIVHLTTGSSARVVRTLHVGDEPRDIVFGGPGKARAFVSTAHRGQNSADDPELHDPSAGRADVWVFDATSLGSSMGGDRLTKLTFFGNKPRALAVSSDGSRVYAAPFYSGNQTTVVSVAAVRTVYASRLDPTNDRRMYFLGQLQPVTGLIVKWKLGQDGQYHWLDAEGTVFDAWVRVQLPDDDVFTIDANANPPAPIAGQTFAHAGTTLFNMAVNPVSGAVYVSNTDAHNDVRFEGHNPTLPVTSVRGENVDSRITVIDPTTGSMVYNDLNPHVVDGVGDGSLSRAFPQDMAVTSDGAKLYVVAQGSGKLGVYDTGELEAGALSAPTAEDQVVLSAGGPSGVVLDEANGRAYVLTRFDNGISTVSLASNQETAHLTLFNPEPAAAIEGRRFLYDATETSENGTQACGGCHIGGNFDALAWDLGNPGGSTLPITTLAASPLALWTFSPAILSFVIPSAAHQFREFASMKGPMTTQSLRGLDNHGSMHWRGDRNGAIQQDGTPFIDPVTNAAVVSAQPDLGMFDEFKAFESFNVAFPGLVGRAAQLPASEMAAFTTFTLDIMYPPNPIRALDNSLSEEEQLGHDIYFQTNASGGELPVDTLHNCNGCHRLDPNGNAGLTDHPGFFGTEGKLSFENLTQNFKVSHFRNIYDKVGMFATAPDPNRTLTPSLSFNPVTPAVVGFGFQPDGANGSVEHHLTGQGFVRTAGNPGGIPTFFTDPSTGAITGVDPQGFTVRRALSSFLMAYPSNFMPIVGQQVTVAAGAGADALARVELMQARAALGDCDLVVRARVRGKQRGYVLSAGAYVSDRSDEAPLSPAALQALLSNEATEALNYLCAPPGSGWRVGIDRDVDGFADGDELAAGSDPASSASTP